jgi:branched-chain amino acid transport system ATP-binding protein
MSFLEAVGMEKRFGGVHAVRGLSIKAEEGTIVSLIGPNGAGKTTAFNLMTGIYSLDSGSVRLDGNLISGLPQHKITRCGVGRTFQNIRLFKGLTCLENVLTAYDHRMRYGLAEALFRFPRRRSEERAARADCLKALELVGLADAADERPENLPYGLQRKLELARALAIGPRVLLLDEPAAGLNPREVEEFIDLVRRINGDLGLTVLLIEHRMRMVMSLSKWIYVMNFGELLAEGRAKDIMSNPAVISAYIGEEEVC